MFSYFWCQTYHRCPRFRKPARIRGSRAYRGRLKYENKKEGFRTYLKYSFNRLLKISLLFEVQSTGILIPGRKSEHHTIVYTVYEIHRGVFVWDISISKYMQVVYPCVMSGIDSVVLRFHWRFDSKTLRCILTNSLFITLSTKTSAESAKQFSFQYLLS